MTTRATLRPGQKGTKRFAAKYGDRLVCVRYKYDAATGRRFTTVELIEEESAWRTEPPAAAKTGPLTQSQRLPVRIDYRESELREKVKATGGIWRPRQKLWEMRYEDIVALGLESRVVAEDELSSEA